MIGIGTIMLLDVNMYTYMYKKCNNQRLFETNIQADSTEYLDPFRGLPHLYLTPSNLRVRVSCKEIGSQDPEYKKSAFAGYGTVTSPRKARLHKNEFHKWNS